MHNQRIVFPYRLSLSLSVSPFPLVDRSAENPPTTTTHLQHTIKHIAQLFSLSFLFLESSLDQNIHKRARSLSPTFIPTGSHKSSVLCFISCLSFAQYISVHIHFYICTLSLVSCKKSHVLLPVRRSSQDRRYSPEGFYCGLRVVGLGVLRIRGSNNHHHHRSSFCIYCQFFFHFFSSLLVQSISNQTIFFSLFPPFRPFLTTTARM